AAPFLDSPSTPPSRCSGFLQFHCFFFLKRRRALLLSSTNRTSLPSRETSHVLVKDTSTWSSFSTITWNFVPLMLQSRMTMCDFNFLNKHGYSGKKK
ncbi:hypothetical protein VIGAN_02109800, partial [Vigna angularis var. angularis]